MEPPYAEASCILKSYILKVNLHCQACKFRIIEVLGSICGEYNIDINAEEGLVRVYALVDPNILMKALARTGYHAELKWAKLQHPRLSRNYYDYDYGCGSYNYRHGHNYGAIDNYPYSHSRHIPYGGYSRALPDPYSYPPQNYSTPSHYYHGSCNAFGRPRPFGF